MVVGAVMSLAQVSSSIKSTDFIPGLWGWEFVYIWLYVWVKRYTGQLDEFENKMKMLISSKCWNDTWDVPVVLGKVNLLSSCEQWKKCKEIEFRVYEPQIRQKTCLQLLAKSRKKKSCIIFFMQQLGYHIHILALC